VASIGAPKLENLIYFQCGVAGIIRYALLMKAKYRVEINKEWSFSDR